MKRVAIWPSPWNYKLENGIFDRGFGPGGAYIQAFQQWRSDAASCGFQLDTWDLVPDGEAEILWFIDLPRRKKEFERAKRSHPNARSVLMVCESPLVCPGMFVEGNRSKFDHIVSYETFSTKKRVKSYRLPVSLGEPKKGRSFADRKLLCMINSNRVEGWFAMRQPGLVGLPGVGIVFSGWRNNLFSIFGRHLGDLYPERRRICRSFDARLDLGIEIFGKGWQGEQISWLPLFPNRPYRTCGGSFVQDRLEVLSSFRFSLAFENWEGRADYITDRVFDAFLAGVVPVYHGDHAIENVLPEGCYVDARKFRRHKELLDYLSSVNAEEWERMRDVGATFLKGEVALQFSDISFGQRMSEVLLEVSR